MIKAMFAYTMVSEGGKELARELGIPRIKHTGSSFVGSPSKKILNWGATTERYPSNLLTCNIINHPSKVDLAVNKLDCFKKFKEEGVSIPEFTESRDEAIEWLESGKMVFARTQLRAHSGRGIAIMNPDHGDTWEVNAPLYVKYVNKRYEYRIHVVNGQVIDTQRKGLRPELSGTEGINWKIRNLANGFIYVRNDGHQVPQCVMDAAVHAVSAVGLDFGAVDVIFNESQNQAYVLEINTAPGLAGTTLEKYKEAFGAM